MWITIHGVAARCCKSVSMVRERFDHVGAPYDNKEV